ncbi:MAG: [FeFe] hydrogenase H-cluster maturation GTPase HydF [Candidatus Cloacimonetes bacterium]|nr:[FeFe] hydrogenase H-cluster maturation GTPase HydF [Candidatus Cloacimonadota bacterium]
MTGVPKGERMNISFIGRINAGKSSVINSLIGQDISIVSEFPGTTTDPVAKRYELIPIGPVTIYDTAGYDDTTDLGEKRIKATLKVLFRSDLVVLVLDINGLNETDKFYINKLNDMKMPYIVVWNKSDLEAIPNEVSAFFDKNNIEVIPISTIDGSGIDVLKEKLVAKIQKLKGNENKILADIIDKEDVIVLVIPIDESAPKGRIILPQVQVIREILDCGAIAVCSREIELSSTLATLKGKIKLVITDSQAIDFVSKTVPDDILLTTFSTLFARYRGDLLPFLDGLEKLKTLKAGDKVLIAEACSHHSMGDDIGRVKIPNWVNKFLGFDLTYTNVNGHDFPDDLEKYKLVIHCGGCMMTRMEILRRINECQRRGVSITNYGMLISFVHGDLQRVIKVFNLKV